MIIKRIYEDDLLLRNYMIECSKRGFNNNTSTESLKFNYFETSAFFAAVENNKIRTLSGVHNFDYDNKRYYRVGFRAATIYDETYKPKMTKNFYKSSLQFGVLFPIQMMWILQNVDSDAQFVMTSTNPVSTIDTAGRSLVVDKVFRKGKILGASLLYENITYLYTLQDVWLLDKDMFLKNFEEIHLNKTVQLDL